MPPAFVLSQDQTLKLNSGLNWINKSTQPKHRINKILHKSSLSNYNQSIQVRKPKQIKSQPKELKCTDILSRTQTAQPPPAHPFIKTTMSKSKNRENLKHKAPARGRVIGPPEWAVKPFSREKFYSRNDRLILSLANPQYSRDRAKKQLSHPASQLITIATSSLFRLILVSPIYGVKIY